MSDTSRPRFGLTLKIFLAVALVVALALGGVLALASARARDAANTTLDQRLANASAVVRRFLAAEQGKLAGASAAAVQNPNSVSAILEGDAATVLDQATTLREVVGADYTLITDRNGVLRARTDQPGDSGGASMGPNPLIGRALEGENVMGYLSNVEDLRLFLTVSTPIRVPPVVGTVQGVLLAAHEVGDSLAAEIQQSTGSEIAFYVLVGEADEPHVVASSVARTAALDSAIGAALSPEMTRDSMASEVRLQMSWGGVRQVGFNRTLVNVGSSRPLGGYVVLRSLDAELAAFRDLQRTLLFVGVGALLLALLASLFVARRIAGPVRALVAATRGVAEGDYSMDIAVTSRDEIGTLAASFRHMLDELKAKQQLVEFLGGGSAAATQRIYMAGGELASPTMVRAASADTGMLQPGQLLANRYEITAVLGMGGMGVVYRALDRELNEAVAIKTLRHEAMATDPALVQRFKDEIRLARKITHRNVVRTHDLGDMEGMYFITMEFVDGQSLKHLIQSRGSLPVAVVLTVGKQLCRALEVAHEQGVIHRDIKPQNIIVEPNGTLKVMDFGIARLATRTEGVTQQGMAIGTPEYMAPEQLLGDEVDFRADIYAAGCVLFECLTGRTPFVADSPIALVAKQLEEVPVSPSSIKPDVPDALSALVLRTLSKDRARRPASAAALFSELDAIAT